jgi:hypothetical protein
VQVLRMIKTYVVLAKNIYSCVQATIHAGEMPFGHSLLLGIKARIRAKFALSLSQLCFDLALPSRTRLEFIRGLLLIPKLKSCLHPSTTELLGVPLTRLLVRTWSLARAKWLIHAAVSRRYRTATFQHDNTFTFFLKKKGLSSPSLVWSISFFIHG